MYPGGSGGRPEISQWQGCIVALKPLPLNPLGRHLSMDPGPSTLHFIIHAKTLLDKALVPYKHAMCGTTQPISNASGLHSHGCEYLFQACAHTPFFSPGELKVCFSRGAGMDRTPSCPDRTCSGPLYPNQLVPTSCSWSRLWSLVMTQVYHRSFLGFQDGVLKLPSAPPPACGQVALCPVGF